MISWLMSRSLFNQVRPHDLLVRDLGLGAVGGGHGHALLSRGNDRSAHLLLGRPDADAAPARGLEVLLSPERPVEPRRGHLDAVLAQVVAQDAGDTLAQGVVDALRMVDVDA